ncbi:hypothetical protein HAV22_29215 [Massilia sp. TW-1]|uniref:TonB-dependent receptor-like beta-barrel domain-containing protein n=1 Tax=Telluria antibiotica TaxID=2717319 RepID=A0ABX0PMR5_9BURK|nr:hypothetical protein [Telluria antibiotica]NIA57714.1 hypothetical protein [Telluria antibiotica]
MPKQSNKFTVYNERNGIMARLSHTFSGALQSGPFNENGITQAAVYREKYKQVDFSSSFDLDSIFDRDGWPTATFNVANANNAKQTYYFQYANATEQTYSGGRTYSLGVHMKF